MDLLAWTPTPSQHAHLRHRSVLASAERLLEKVLPPIEEEPEGRLADALAALLAALEGPPEDPAAPRIGTRRRRYRTLKGQRV